jgi:hypothetical protein
MEMSSKVMSKETDVVNWYLWHGMLCGDVKTCAGILAQSMLTVSPVSKVKLAFPMSFTTSTGISSTNPTLTLLQRI